MAPDNPSKRVVNGRITKTTRTPHKDGTKSDHLSAQVGSSSQLPKPSQTPRRERTLPHPHSAQVGSSSQVPTSSRRRVRTAASSSKRKPMYGNCPRCRYGTIQRQRINPEGGGPLAGRWRFVCSHRNLPIPVPVAAEVADETPTRRRFTGVLPTQTAATSTPTQAGPFASHAGAGTTAAADGTQAKGDDAVNGCPWWQLLDEDPLKTLLERQNRSPVKGGLCPQCAKGKLVEKPRDVFRFRERFLECSRKMADEAPCNFWRAVGDTSATPGSDVTPGFQMQMQDDEEEDGIVRGSGEMENPFVGNSKGKGKEKNSAGLFSVSRKARAGVDMPAEETQSLEEAFAAGLPNFGDATHVREGGGGRVVVDLTADDDNDAASLASPMSIIRTSAPLSGLTTREATPSKEAAAIAGTETGAGATAGAVVADSAILHSAVLDSAAADWDKFTDIASIDEMEFVRIADKVEQAVKKVDGDAVTPKATSQFTRPQVNSQFTRPQVNTQVTRPQVNTQFTRSPVSQFTSPQANQFTRQAPNQTVASPTFGRSSQSSASQNSAGSSPNASSPSFRGFSQTASSQDSEGTEQSVSGQSFHGFSPSVSSGHSATQNGPSHNLGASSLGNQSAASQNFRGFGQTVTGANVARPNFAGANVARTNVARPNVARPNFAGANVARTNADQSNAARSNIANNSWGTFDDFDAADNEALIAKADEVEKQWTPRKKR